MKKKIMCFGLLVLILVMTLSTVATAEVAENQKANIIISNAKEGDTFAAYRIVDVAYDLESNALSYAINPTFAPYFTAQSVTLNVFNSWASDSTNLKEFIAGLNSWIDSQTTTPTPVDTAITLSTGIATLDNLDMGYYYIKTTASDDIYVVMSAWLVPTATATAPIEYVLNDIRITAKSQGMNIDKSVVDKKENGYFVGDDVYYQIVTDVPTYPDEATNETYIVSDTMSAALTFNNDAVAYGVLNGLDSLLTENVHYDLFVPGTGGETFLMDFTYDEIALYDQIKVVYSAKINSNAIAGSPITNTARLEYSNWPYSNSTAIIDTTNDTGNPENPENPDNPPVVYTYGVRILKQETGTGIALADAEFDIYREAQIDETGVNLEGMASTRYFIKLNTAPIVTGNNGYAAYSGIAAGTYYLVETYAPTGYNKLDEPVTVTFTPEQTGKDAGPSFGYFGLTVNNSKGFTLPDTGGIGTLWFVTGGMVLIAVSVTLIFYFKKKAKRAVNPQ